MIRLLVIHRGARLALLYFSLACVGIRFPGDLQGPLGFGGHGVFVVSLFVSLGALFSVLVMECLKRAELPRSLLLAGCYAMGTGATWVIGAAVHASAPGAAPAGSVFALLLLGFFVFAFGGGCAIVIETDQALTDLGDDDHFYLTVRGCGSAGFVAGGLVLSLGVGPALSPAPYWLAALAQGALSTWSFSTRRDLPPRAAHRLPAIACGEVLRATGAAFCLLTFGVAMLPRLLEMWGVIWLRSLGSDVPEAWYILAQVPETVILLVLPVAVGRIGHHAILLLAVPVAWLGLYSLWYAGAITGLTACVPLGLLLFQWLNCVYATQGQRLVQQRLKGTGLEELGQAVLACIFGMGQLAGTIGSGLAVRWQTSAGETDWPAVWMSGAGSALVALLVAALLVRQECRRSRRASSA